jgi:hypothetical protein
MRLLVLGAALLSLAIGVRPLSAQSEVPSLRWRTITTENFRIHYEPELRAWAEDVAVHIESVRTAVAARIGYTPPQVIDLIVEDPFNLPNGSAWPTLTTPAMRFWATPPAPTSVLGNSRGWGEVLAVHEYAHLAHLLRPSRAPFAPLRTLFSGLPFGPLVTVPGWVAEGYATLIEGELTGAGRPNGVARPALLRQLALEGALPTYGGLDATGGFNGGSMRYLVGSAYLEWLQEQRGDSALPQLWRRASARQKRDFPEAFRGIFGEDPAVMYGRFASEFTAKSHTARAALEAQPLAQGTLAQHWSWYVGAPAISPDGSRLAVRQSAPSAGTRVRVLSFESKPMKKADSLKAEKRWAKDPEDVRPISIFPKPYKQEAALGPVGGAGFDAPRWFADNERLLVVRAVPSRDGRVRPDLFVWNSKSGRVRRVTRGAGIALADPFPDGRQAAALTCGAGTCSIALVDLESGAVRTLAAGGLDRAYAGVRVSPNGRRIASAVQDGATWRTVVIDVATGSLQAVGQDDVASRYAPAWENDSSLVVVSEASGVAVLERVALGGLAPVVVARSTGAAGFPDVGPDGRTWWLDLHARGYDLRVTDAGAAHPLGAPLDTALYPAVQRRDTALAVTFAATEVPESKPYGIGPFGAAMIATTSTAADGDAFGIGVSAGDPLGRWNGQLLLGLADSSAWRGGRASLTWRGLRPGLQVQGWSAAHDPSTQQRLGGPGLASFDARYAGGLVATDYEWSGVRSSSRVRALGSTGVIENPSLGGPSITRTLYAATLESQVTFSPTPKRRVLASLQTHGSTGTTGGVAWDRVMAEAALGATRLDGLGVGVRGRVGETSADAPLWEQFTVGGTASAFVDAAVLGQRIEQPGLPFAARGGRRLAMLAAETTGPVRAYHEWIAAGDDYGPWTRLIGLEIAMETPRLAVLRLPVGRVRTGISHVLNAPVANATVVYAALHLLP